MIIKEYLLNNSKNLKSLQNLMIISQRNTKTSTRKTYPILD